MEVSKSDTVNKAINEFFRGRPKNSQGYEWFNPKDCLVHTKLRDICDSLTKFFSNRYWYNGGRVPCDLLYTKRNFRLCNNITVVDALDLAYDCIKQAKQLAKTTYRKNVEIALALKIIHECEGKDIPQDYIGGLFLLYLELCERVVLL